MTPRTVAVVDSHCGRSLAYDLIRRGEFPCPVLRLGNRRYVIPTTELLRVVGIDTNDPPIPHITP